MSSTIHAAYDAKRPNADRIERNVKLSIPYVKAINLIL